MLESIYTAKHVRATPDDQVFAHAHDTLAFLAVAFSMDLDAAHIIKRIMDALELRRDAARLEAEYGLTSPQSREAFRRRHRYFTARIAEVAYGVQQGPADA